MLDETRPCESADPSLSLPTELEAQCLLLYERDGLTQEQIAERLRMHQTSVARAIARANDKIAALRACGRFDPDEMDLILQKITGRAAFGRKLM